MKLRHKGMTRTLSLAAILIFALSASLPASAPGGRGRRDPLTEAEIDQLREQAQEPVARLRLYIKFTGARMVDIEEVPANAKVDPKHGQKVHDLLEDFSNLIDEIDDNLDNYSEHGSDIRKPLKELIDAEANWSQRLHALKDAIARDPQVAKEARDYSFALDTAIDSVDDSAESARKTLEEQNASLKTKKKK
jgi:chromosome segregation ATPase